jgi:hypothetical protein
MELVNARLFVGESDSLVFYCSCNWLVRPCNSAVDISWLRWRYRAGHVANSVADVAARNPKRSVIRIGFAGLVGEFTERREFGRVGYDATFGIVRHSFERERGVGSAGAA